MKVHQRLVCLLSILFLSGCSLRQMAGLAPSAPTPTTHGIFAASNNHNATSEPPASSFFSSPTVASIFSAYNTVTPLTVNTATPDNSPSELPSATLIPTAPDASPQPTPLATEDLLNRLIVYDDALSLNWYLQPLQGIDVNMSDTTHVHSGKKAIAITPQNDFKTFYLTVNQTSNIRYSRDQVLGLSFWLNSGSGTIKLSDLAITITGSNDVPYWVNGDNSVFKNSGNTFSETRLYDLGFNYAIPPETWVEVIVYPSKLIQDPPYQYVTGFYIKNDKGFHQTFYVDDISLLAVNTSGTPGATLTPGGNLPGASTTAPTLTITLTPSVTATPTRTRTAQ